LIRGDAAHPLHSTHVAARPSSTTTRIRIGAGSVSQTSGAEACIMGQRRLKGLVMGHPNGLSYGLSACVAADAFLSI
jgi:hypothetical protein